MGTKDSSFELYHNNYSEPANDAITITADHHFYFLSTFSQKHKLDSKKAIQVYFNKATDEIAIVFLGEVISGSYKMHVPQKRLRYGGRVNARGFFNAHGLYDTVKIGRYHYREIDLNGQKAFVIKAERL